MRRHQVQWMIVPVALIVAVGCQQNGGGNSAPSASVSPAAASQASSVAPRVAAARSRPTFAGHGGIASSLFHAAHDRDLTQAQQRSLDKIEGALKGDDESIRAAMTTFRADLMAGVKPGKLDTAKLTADDGLVDKAIADHQLREAEALDSRHALLDLTQRTTFVASVRVKLAERETRMTGWMRGKGADGATLDWNKRRLEKLTTDLTTLERDQQKHVAAIFAKASDPPNAASMQSRWDDRKKRAEALLTSFANDAFDAKTLDLTVQPGKTAHEPMDQMVAFFSGLLPILYANQRDMLAESLDRPFGGGGHSGMPGGAPVRGPADDIAFPFAEPLESEEPSAPAR